MGGFNLGGALGGAGVMLKSARDYQTESALQQQQIEQGANRTALQQQEIQQQQNATAESNIKAGDLSRVNDWQQQDRDLASKYMAGMGQTAQQSVAVPAAPVAPPVVPAGAPGSLPAPGAAQPSITSDNAGATRPDNAPSASPMGSATLSTPNGVSAAPTPPAQSPLTPLPAGAPGGPPALPSVAVAGAPASLPQAPTPPALANPNSHAHDITPNHPGLLDALEAQATARGDLAGAARYRQAKQAMLSEGAAQTFHYAIQHPDDVNGITNIMNKYGDTRVVPGTLVKGPGLTYTATVVNQQGQVTPNQPIDVMKAAVLIGAIPGPQLVTTDPQKNNAMRMADGTFVPLNDAHKSVTIAGRDGAGYATTDEFAPANAVTITGQRGGQSPDEKTANSQVLGIIQHEAARRADPTTNDPGTKDKPNPAYKQPINAASVGATAQNIINNTPGITSSEAADVALKIADKDPGVKFGIATGQSGAKYQEYSVNGKQYRVGTVAAPPPPTPKAAPAPKPAAAPQPGDVPANVATAAPEAKKKQADVFKSSAPQTVASINSQLADAMSRRGLQGVDPQVELANEMRIRDLSKKRDALMRVPGSGSYTQ